MNTHRAWLWPDHVAGERETRRLREEHNALVSSHAELLRALKTIVDYGDVGMGGRPAYHDMRAVAHAAIQKAGE